MVCGIPSKYRLDSYMETLISPNHGGRIRRQCRSSSADMLFSTSSSSPFDGCPSCLIHVFFLDGINSPDYDPYCHNNDLDDDIWDGWVQEINLQIGYFTHQTRCHQHHIACCTGLTELGNRHFVEWRHWGNTSVLPPMLSLQLKLTWIHGSVLSIASRVPMN
ncbi:hypothetical protein RHMOL_Rhmol10G0106400 [Rhododendron molle]|uniref:Uncharacterized protein n=1 Tax=Rhododendron molle TaxID=49168 RepID=A0ACC0M194_RHOML|nr:hypothetical protein RHMOL_Rhmol10G0106400 [Rhododendron molle]